MRKRAYSKGSWFTRFAKATARDRPAGDVLSPSSSSWCGPSRGPLFGFSDTWQLVINTGTTIVTFLMVFLIQNTQNRDSRGDAGQARRADPRDRRRAQRAARSRGARRRGPGADLLATIASWRSRARKDLRAGKSDTDVREVGPRASQRDERKEVSGRSASVISRADRRESFGAFFLDEHHHELRRWVCSHSGRRHARRSDLRRTSVRVSA